MAKRKWIALLLGTPIALVLVAVLVVAFNPLWRPEAEIRKSLFRQTPLGTSYDEVHSFVERRGWLDRSYIGNGGYYYQPAGGPNRVVGSYSIRAELGHYGLIFKTSVTVFWGFDDDRRLIDIWVWKTTDAL